MKRDLDRLDQREFDLVVVGGGIFGACAAWDASSRGLSVALLERGDFGGATSANSLKMVHGGIRYLQHLDLYRIRQSSAERSAFLSIAPHLVSPLPIVVPTFGHLRKGKAVLRTGAALYDLLTADRNRRIRDGDRRVPWTTGMTRDAVLELFPDLPGKNLTGAAVFCDGQMHNPPRLVWAIVRTAMQEGAVAANHVEVTELIEREGRVRGVLARDRLSGDPVEVRGRFVLNAAGPYAEALLDRSFQRQRDPVVAFSRDACFLVRRLFQSPYAIAVPGATSDPDAKLSRGARHLFVCPWRQYTLIGVWHRVYSGDPDGFRVTEEELNTFITELSESYPGLGMTTTDVTMVNSGLVPFGDNPDGAVNLRYGHRSRLIDHASVDGVEGLLSLIGVRFTTGRYEAARAIDLVLERLDRRSVPSRTAHTPVHGGDIDSIGDHLETWGRRDDLGLPREALESLARNYGSQVAEVVETCKQEDLLRIVEGTVVAGQVVHAVREEMAQTLSDVVYRRTDLGTGEVPSRGALERCAQLMASELGWTAERQAAEVSQTLAEPGFWVRANP